VYKALRILAPAQFEPRGQTQAVTFWRMQTFKQWFLQRQIDLRLVHSVRGSIGPGLGIEHLLKKIHQLSPSYTTQAIHTFVSSFKRYTQQSYGTQHKVKKEILERTKSRLSLNII
jgi:hypothetical protein